MRRVPMFCYAAGLVGVLAGLAAAQTCSPFWIKPNPFDRFAYDAPDSRNGPVVFDDGSGPALYATVILGLDHAGVARWDGHRWTHLLDGTPPLALVSWFYILDDGSGPRLYIWAAPQAPPLVGQAWIWDGSAWQPPPPGLFVQEEDWAAGPACSFNDGTGMAIYGGYADNSGYFPAKWDGQRWNIFGPTLIHLNSSLMDVQDLGDGPVLYWAGQFDMVGVGRGIVRWDRTHGWRAMGSGLVCGQINDLEVFDAGHGKELYVCGELYSAGGIPVNGIAKWDGQQWSAVPGADTPGFWRGLAVFDDGSGPALYVTGDFTVAGGIPARHIARYDGKRWSALGAGVPAPSRQMVVFDDGRGPSLFVSTAGGPTATTGGGLIGGGLAQWVGCPNCYADCDNDHQLNVNDFVCFLQKYPMRDPYTNCTVDQVINTADFVCFMNKFAQGCP